MNDAEQQVKPQISRVSYRPSERLNADPGNRLRSELPHSRAQPLHLRFVGNGYENEEVALVPEIQWHFNSCVFPKAGTGVRVTSKATDLAPEVGVVFAFY